MDEFKRWMYGEIELPTKSVLITVDDGAKGTGAHNGNKLIPLLEEYKMHATLFLIAGWWDISNYSSPYLEVQSHTYDMHQYGSCKKGQLVCATYEEAKTDLEKSLAIVNNNDSFCYPFYSYSDTAIQAIKDTGFKLAFIGGNRKAKRSNNKYLIPRYPIHSDITMERFIEIVS
jgi:peptidoglycan/xylan/chitin deacetylase (PgdA/CDA1 family)